MDLMNGIHTNFDTAWVIALACAILIAWDYYTFKTEERGDTISEVTLRSSMKKPWIPFLMGVLMGHLFWPQVITVIREVSK